MHQQNYQLGEAKIASIDKINAMIEKNHGRVIKSVPDKFIKGFATSTEKKAMEEKKAEILLKLKQAEATYRKLLLTYKQKDLV